MVSTILHFLLTLQSDDPRAIDIVLWIFIVLDHNGLDTVVRWQERRGNNGADTGTNDWKELLVNNKRLAIDLDRFLRIGYLLLVEVNGDTIGRFVHGEMAL